jgi:exodeoxyribonuclease VII large subunit
VDVIVVTRGGGSLEDLWAFNEEIVARAIARSRLPIISAVGHEIDFTIADFVADLRAPTPSAAAELVVRAKDELLAELRQYQHRLDKDLRYRLSEARRRLASCALRQPDELVRQYQQRVDDLAHRLDHATGNTLETQRHRLTRAREKLQLLTPQAFVRQLRHRLATADQRLTGECARHRQAFRHRFATLAGKLELLSPKSTLARGYSITRTPSGRVVRTVGDVQPGQSVRTLVTDGEFESVVAGS